MQFMNSSLDQLAKNLSDGDFKYLTEELCSTNLELLKENILILMSIGTVSENLVKTSCLIGNAFTGL